MPFSGTNGWPDSPWLTHILTIMRIRAIITTGTAMPTVIRCLIHLNRQPCR